MNSPHTPTPPRHVAIVMDGNGRWARKRFMPRLVGHKFGLDALMRVIGLCQARGIEYLTVFAFSSENWRRPDEEVSGLMNLAMGAVTRYLGDLIDQGVRIRIVGDRRGVRDNLCQAWDEAESRSAQNTALTLSVAFNYGGRWDVVQATQAAMRDGLKPEDITEAALSSRMALAHAPDPDLFIRTGGEVRLSNFLLWQTAYSELVFSDCLWPDFGADELDAALAHFAQRDRRFGGVKDTAPC